MSFGGLGQKKSPFLSHKILWRHVTEVDITVGEQDEAGDVQTPSVGGEGAFVEVLTVVTLTVIPKIGGSPPFAPTTI